MQGGPKLQEAVKQVLQQLHRAAPFVQNLLLTASVLVLLALQEKLPSHDPVEVRRQEVVRRL